MQIVLTSLAKTYIDRGFDFYMNGGEDIAIRFVETVLDKLSELESKAGIYANVFKHDRMLVKPFPYAIYYDIVKRDCSGSCGIGLQAVATHTPRPSQGSLLI